MLRVYNYYGTPVAIGLTLTSTLGAVIIVGIVLGSSNDTDPIETLQMFGCLTIDLTSTLPHNSKYVVLTYPMWVKISYSNGHKNGSTCLTFEKFIAGKFSEIQASYHALSSTTYV